MIRMFKIKEDAHDYMLMKNRTTVRGPIYVMVDGPEDDFAVMPLNEAVENNFVYSWSV